jgi:hypothetical protein
VACVVFYISGHGFGHAIRQIAIINALQTIAPAVRVVVRSNAADWLFRRTVRGEFTLDPAETDTGLVQIDGLQPDEHASVAHAREFYRGFPDLVRRECTWLRAQSAQLVIADAPPLACAAADHAGVPSVVCANFTWDWIYEAYAAEPGVSDLLTTIRAAYACARDGWRMPLHGGFDSVRRIVDLPFVARHARRDRAVPEIRHELDLPVDRRLALASFGGYGLRQLPLDRLDCTSSWDIVVTSSQPLHGTLPAGVHHIDEDRLYARGLRYEDLVKAVDVVVTKPGYGIVSDCVANGTAMLYTSRGRFAEYDVMVEELPRILRCRFIDQADFTAGRWEKALAALSATPQLSEQPRTDGADVAARMIVEAVSAP